MSDLATPVEAPPVSPTPPAAPKEPTIAERAHDLLDHVRAQAEHNAPISAHIMDELAVVVAHVTGEKAPADKLRAAAADYDHERFPT